jgi:hypothetical protein
MHAHVCEWGSSKTKIILFSLLCIHVHVHVLFLSP